MLRDIDSFACSLKQLSLKLALLLALTSGQRVQTLSALNLDFTCRDKSRFTFHINKVLKTSRPGVHHSVQFNKFDLEPKLCPFRNILCYIDRTEDIRSDSFLFISYVRPFKPISAQSLSRWISLGLREAGVPDTFSAHSVRHASSSHADMRRVPMDSILRTVGWSKEKTFATFYRKDISDPAGDYSTSILATDSATNAI